MTRAGKSPSPVDDPQVVRRIAHDYFVRFHMSVILAAVISSGVLASKCLMALGVSLGFRYPIAVLASYGVFLGLVRVWIWYVSVHAAAAFQLANLDFSGSGGGSGGSLSIGGGSGGSGSGGGFSGFGGGTSGGGGASSSWEGNEAAAIVSQPSPAPSGSHWWPSFNLDLGDDDSWVIVLLIALVACILGGGVYLVYAAPHILPEAAGQVILAGTLTRVSKEEHHNWMAGVIWSTWIPFVIVLLMAGVLGWEAHRHCPAAHRLIDVLNCAGK
jgi:hypothetical protein